MNPGQIKIVLTGVILLFNLTAFGADYYVDLSGSDGGTGSAGDPFRTISRAAEAAGPGDTVWIGAGTYRETVRPARSGEPDAPIVYRSLDSEDRAVVNGTDVVEGPWTQVGDGDVYVADWVGEYDSINMQADQLFLDGEMINLLRWPKETNNNLTHPNNAQIDDVIAFTFGTRAGPMTIKEATFNEPDGRWDGARVWVNISPPDKGDGQGQTGWIITTDQSDSTIIWEGINDVSKSTIGNSNNYAVLPGNFYYLFDPTPAGLAATGGPEAALGEREWWLNRESGKLYVRFPTGSTPANHLVEAKRRDWGFDLSDLSHITITDLDLFSTSITTDPDPVADKPEVTVSTGVILDGLKVWYSTHFTNMDIDLDWQGSWMGQSGVILSGSHHVVRNCEFYWSAGSHLSVTGIEHRVYNNLLEDFNYNVTEAAGINMSKDRSDSLSLDHKVGYNTLRSSPGAGIFFKTALNSDPDIPGMYRLHNNLIYDILHNITDAAILKTVGTDLRGARVDHNILHGGNGYIQFGIYVDYGGGIYIDHNVVYDTWSAIGGNAYDSVRVTNNVALATPTYWAFQPEGIRSGRDLAGPVWLYNNIMSGNYNRWDDPLVTLDANIGRSRTSLYPLFVYADDENFEDHDYRLKGTATEAIDQGVVVPGFDDPIIGSAPDIGAYEYGREPWVAGYGTVPWYLDDDDSLRYAAQNTTLNGTAVLHSFSGDSPVTGLTVVETSPGISVELGASMLEPDGGLEIQCTVSESAPAPATGWFILEGTQKGSTHRQGFTFRLLPEQTLERIEWVNDWEEPVTFFPNARIEFPVEFFDTDGFLMAVEQETQWSVTGGGAISDGKLRTELSQGGPYTLAVQSGDVERSLTFNVQVDWVSGQPVTASSFKNPDVVPENAIDDDEGTPWVSDASDDEWIEIDMGEFVAIETVQIYWHQQLYGSRYELQVSDYGQDWRTLFVAQLDEGGFVTHDALREETGRYFRIQGLERAVNTGYAIYGITVQGDSATGILGDSLSEPSGWRWSHAVGWFYDENPGKNSHAVYFYSHGWQHITGPGLFFRSDQFWGYDYARAEWWWYNTYYGRWRFFVSSGWERI